MTLTKRVATVLAAVMRLVMSAAPETTISLAASGPSATLAGGGNDILVDFNYKARNKNPDYFRCGPGRDEVSNNKGLDRVADDCEVLHAARY
jgi:hypothetical protein